MARRLSAADWVDAALDRLADGGLPAVAVEPIAASLGVTKGSFYSHFSTRDELLVAAIESWRVLQLEQMAPADSVEDLLTSWFADARLGGVFGSLCAAVADSTVRPAVFEVSAARATRLAELLVAEGWGEEDAAARARVIDAAYVGFWRLVEAGALPVEERSAFRAELSTLAHSSSAAA
ncbi:MAG: helix-turn-helix domain-containing protein [Actinomycetota bacterium]